jgi:serine/threonine protein kinase
MATVHLARWSVTGVERLVALKLMQPEIAASEEYRAMFREEARIAARLRHQFLVDIHEIGEEAGQLFLAMEYLEGASLASIIAARKERNHNFDVAVLARIFANLAEGLHAIHSHGDGGYVHRDISPHNLFVLRDGSVRIADFGVALDPAWPRLGEQGFVKGKVAYLAPELLEGAPPTASVDLWALGVVIWEALAGQRLFPGRNIVSVAREVRTRVIVAPSTFRAGIPPALDALVLSLLDRDWQQRPRTGREVSLALSRIVLDMGVTIESSRVGEWLREVTPADEAEVRGSRPTRPRMVLPTVREVQSYAVVTDAPTPDTGIRAISQERPVVRTPRAVDPDAPTIAPPAAAPAAPHAVTPPSAPRMSLAVGLVLGGLTALVLVLGVLLGMR